MLTWMQLMLKIRWNWRKKRDLLIKCWNSNTHLKISLQE
uniref:Short coiled-coil protein n=1 Tax=Rousettus aegyptiacus TaxID=9407 RepID=A0A7J8BU54_ROUAE|nr:short coiled-coil protein [Rousettus aegyptiacus]